MANEMNFAETVMLVDAAYLNRVCGDLKSTLVPYWGVNCQRLICRC